MKADFSKIVSQSLHITKSNKRLWILGLVFASFSVSSGFDSGTSFRGLSGIFKDTNKQNRLIYKPDPYERKNLINYNLLAPGNEVSQVLGASTSSLSVLTAIFSLIPVSFFAALAFLLFLFIFLGLTIYIYTQSWAQASLICGINYCDNQEDPSLFQMSNAGRERTIEIVKIKIVSALVFLFLAALFVMFLLAPMILLGAPGKLLTIVLIIPAALVFVALSAVVFASANLGALYAALDSASWKDAFKKGFYLFKSAFFEVMVIFVINFLVSWFVALATLLLLTIFGTVGAAFGAILAGEFKMGTALFTSFFFIFQWVFISVVLKILLVVFRQSNWVLLYKQLTASKDSKEAYGVN